MRPFPFALLLLIAATQRKAESGEDVIRQMYQRYRHEWVRSFTFEQKTTLADGSVETWYEAGELPGRLRIDIASPPAGRAILFRADSLYNYRNARRGRGGPFVHPLLLVLYDVHFLPPDTTIARLRTLGYDLSRSHESTWQGRTVIVVGANAGDTTSAQLWIEKERLLPVRVFHVAANAMTEERIGGYERMGKGWGERLVETWQKGSRIQIEEYRNVRANVTHESGLFEPAVEYAVPKWVADALKAK